MARCFLALGSNLGDRAAQLMAAVSELRRRGVQPLRSGSVYETEPKELLAQPWFLNTVVEADTDLDPEGVLRTCREIEDSFGRRRETRHGPRTIDIDIIFFDDRVVGTAELTVPHPRYRGRRFVLEPLAEIAPDVLDPISGKPVREILEAARDEASVKRIGPPLL